jgi:hypothetical protein
MLRSFHVNDSTVLDTSALAVAEAYDRQFIIGIQLAD